jgi:hypothetical protein
MKLLPVVCCAGEEGVIRHLLSRDDEEFGLLSLVIFFFGYMPLTLIVRSLPIPMGSFVPNLLLGALVGRIVGEVAQEIYPHSLISEPGVFALVGAGAMLGAWTRTMIAIVVTLLEVSGDIGLVNPLICSVIIARYIATAIEGHSYTHALFYNLVDAPGSDTHKLHPDDWQGVVEYHEDEDPGIERSSSVKNFMSLKKEKSKLVIKQSLGYGFKRKYATIAQLFRRKKIYNKQIHVEPLPTPVAVSAAAQEEERGEEEL